MRSLAFAIAAAALTAAAPEQEPSLRQTLAGAWGYEAEGGMCAGRPHTIEFSADGAEMVLRYSDPPGQGTYKVLAEETLQLRVAMRDEVERTNSGTLVEWDLILLSPDAYTWHRSDWPAGHRTWPVKRCTETVPQG